MKLITDLKSDNLKALALSIAIPSMLSQLVSVFYSIIDRMYIGNIESIGNLALAGVGVCGPIITGITSFAFLVGIGTSPLLSRSLGENDHLKAQKVMNNAFLLILIISFLVTNVSYLFKDWMLYSFGASDNIYIYANEYLSIYIIGIAFSLVATGMNQLIICQGFGKNGMISVMMGALINIILDPIFIFAFDLGVKGAAFATLISQLVSCIYVLSFLFSSKALIKIRFNNYSINIMLKILKIGMTYFLIVIFDNFMLIALNSILQKYGGINSGDMLLTCNTILQSFMLIITMPLGGLTTGTQTILGYNLGAKRFDKIIKAQKIIFTIALVFCSFMFLASWIISKYFVLLFTKTPEYINLTVHAIKLSTIGIIPLAIQYEIVDGFTGLGEIKISLILSALRKIVYFVLIFTLPLFIKIENIFIAETISDILPVIISIIVYIIWLKKLKNKLSR